LSLEAAWPLCRSTCAGNDVSKQSSVDRIWDIIESVGVCMLATQRSGRLRARPMEPRPDRKRRLIFAVTDAHSAKLDEIEARPDIGLIFIDAKAKAYLSITGRACVTRDISNVKRGGNKRHVEVREVMNGVMYILSTGCQWRTIPKDLPPRSTLFDYLDLWSYDGTLDRIHHALYVECREQGEREASPTAAIVDSQSVKSAEKGGPASIRMVMTRAKRSRGRSAIFS
jgi:transposase